MAVELKKISQIAEALNVTLIEEKRGRFTAKDCTQDLCRLVGEDTLARYGFMVSASLGHAGAAAPSPHASPSRFNPCHIASVVCVA